MKLDVEAITVTRTAAGSYVSGRFVAGTSQDHPARGNIQPLTGLELLQLAEGDRQREVKKIYTAFALANGDVVTRADGTRFEVQAVEDWTAFHQPHYKARLVRIEEA
jgi:hypothetical protein